MSFFLKIEPDILLGRIFKCLAAFSSELKIETTIYKEHTNLV